MAACSLRPAMATALAMGMQKQRRASTHLVRG